jgi:hypothetical protein
MRVPPKINFPVGARNRLARFARIRCHAPSKRRKKRVVFLFVLASKKLPVAIFIHPSHILRIENVISRNKEHQRRVGRKI